MDALLRSRALRSGRLIVARTCAIGTALTTALSVPTAAGATSPWPWRASRFEGLLLLGRQDLIELGLGVFFEFCNLLLLVFREVQLLDRERRDQMEPATGSTTAARSTGTTAAWTARGTVLRSRSHGCGSNYDDAKNHDECGKTSHGDTP
jgi:hypothetical protein